MVKIKKYFDKEICKTLMWSWILFNCTEKKSDQGKKIFTKDFMPYEIGFISKDRNNVNLSDL